MRSLYRKYGVQGLPALVFLDKRGVIRHDLTITEDVPPEDVLSRLRSLR